MIQHRLTLKPIFKRLRQRNLRLSVGRSELFNTRNLLTVETNMLQKDKKFQMSTKAKDDEKLASSSTLLTKTHIRCCLLIKIIGLF